MLLEAREALRSGIESEQATVQVLRQRVANNQRLSSGKAGGRWEGTTDSLSAWAEGGNAAQMAAVHLLHKAFKVNLQKPNSSPSACVEGGGASIESIEAGLDTLFTRAAELEPDALAYALHLVGCKDWLHSRAVKSCRGKINAVARAAPVHALETAGAGGLRSYLQSMVQQGPALQQPEFHRGASRALGEQVERVLVRRVTFS